MSKEREQYTMGYGKAATAIMALRTARRHAAFFLPYLNPRMRLLDCGCGPGTVTLGFAGLLTEGQVIGTEIEETQVTLARAQALDRHINNARFEVADIYGLPFEDSSFDAVFISAVLGNLREPVRGLREAYRVLKPGGVIGVKEFDHGGDIIYPPVAALRQYGELYLRLRREYGHDPESGRKIGSLLFEAGFTDLKLAASYESFADPQMLSGFAEVSIGLLAESWGGEFMHRSWASAEEIKGMSDAWRNFAGTKGAIFAAAWCEAVARKA